MPSLSKSVRAMAAVIEAMISVARNPRDVLSRFYLMRSVGKIILPKYRYKWPQTRTMGAAWRRPESVSATGPRGQVASEAPEAINPDE